MKLLITNPDAIVDLKSGDYYLGLKDVLTEFDAVEGQQVIVISNTKSKLSTVEKDFYVLEVDGKARAGRILVEIIQKQLKLPISDIFILGCKQEDVGLAANNKLLLLRADYTKSYFGEERLFEHEYGIKINDANHLKLILNKFINIKEPWYYKCVVSDSTVVYSLTNANTMGIRAPQAIPITDAFRNLLKSGVGSYKDEFMIYFLISSYSIFKEFETVNYWGIYPSSTGEDNQDLEYFSKKVRQSFGGRPNEPILLRHSAGVKRHKLTSAAREANGCAGEFDTLILNPFYLKGNKLQGKTVCIIDDFSTQGTSCETSRHLLELAGVRKIIFITMGKFGKVYNKYDYSIKGSPFLSYSYQFNEVASINGTFNTSSDIEFITSLGGLVK